MKPIFVEATPDLTYEDSLLMLDPFDDWEEKEWLRDRAFHEEVRWPAQAMSKNEKEKALQEALRRIYRTSKHSPISHCM